MKKFKQKIFQKIDEEKFELIENKGFIPGDLKNLYIDNEINVGKNIDLLITIPSLFKDDDGNEKKF